MTMNPPGQTAPVHVHDPDVSFCPAMPGIEPHDYHPYFDLRTLSTVLFCTRCADQQLVLPDSPSVVSPQNFGQINNNSTQPPTQPVQSPGSGIFNP